MMHSGKLDGAQAITTDVSIMAAAGDTKKRWGIFALLAAVGLASIWFLTGDQGTLSTESDEQPYSHTREVSYGYTLRNTSGSVRNDPVFRTYAPVGQTAFQRIERITANVPFKQSTDALGNRILRFDSEPIPPFGTRLVEIRVLLATGTSPHATPLDNVGHYLMPEEQIEASHPSIVGIANKFRHLQPVQRAHSLYSWLVDNLSPGSYQPRSHGALSTLNTRTGDCTEFAQLYVALARAAGLLARVMAGYHQRDTKRLRADELHNWAEVYLDKVWRIIDPHAQRFLEDEQSYIAMTVLSRPAELPLGGHRRFHITDPKVSVEMN